jgi:16S rRNA processing protein RimM
MSQRHNKEIDSSSNLIGSSDVDEPKYIAIAKLRRPHGIHGEIMMEVLTDFPERLEVDKEYFVGDDYELLRLKKIRPHNKGLLVSFEGYNIREEIERLRNSLVQIRMDSLPELPSGEYYFHQLTGLTVIDKAGKVVGSLKEIIETGANDVYIVESPKGDEILLPAIDEVILDVNLEEGLIRVCLPIWE